MTSSREDYTKHIDRELSSPTIFGVTFNVLKSVCGTWNWGGPDAGDMSYQSITTIFNPDEQATIAFVDIKAGMQIDFHHGKASPRVEEAALSFTVYPRDPSSLSSQSEGPFRDLVGDQIENAYYKSSSWSSAEGFYRLHGTFNGAVIVPEDTTLWGLRVVEIRKNSDASRLLAFRQLCEAPAFSPDVKVRHALCTYSNAVFRTRMGYIDARVFKALPGGNDASTIEI